VEQGVDWLTEEQGKAWEAYITAAHLVERAVAHQLRIGAELSHGDYALLHRLSIAPEKSLRMGEIALRQVAPKSRISYQVDQLVKRGLVRREPHPEDARGLMAVLTDKGQRLLEETAPGHVATVRQHFIDLLDDDQLQTLGDICAQLTARLRAMDI
jgi:DNA-binding MarR family transcriptional regulator